MAQKREILPLATKAGADGDSRLFSCESLVNMYAEAAKGQAISQVKLVSAPGYDLFATIGGGPARGSRRFGRFQYSVMGEGLWVLPDGATAPATATQVNTSPGVPAVIQGSNFVEMDWNRTQIGILGEGRFYVYLPATGVLSEVTDTDLVNPVSFAMLDSYGLLVEESSDTLQITDLADITSVDGLSFVAAESTPDELVAVRACNGEAVLLGADTVEFFVDTGSTDNVFQRSTAAAPMGVGCLCRDAAVVMDNSLVWLGRQAEGGLVVFRANGYVPQRVSTHTIETWIEKAGALALTARAFAQSAKGHLFYVLTIPGYGTRALDMATNEWHQRAAGSWPTTQPGPPLSDWGALAFAPNGTNGTVGRSDGNIYRLSQDIYTQDGVGMTREFVLPPFFKGGRPFTVDEIEFIVEAGVGLTDVSLAASNPQLICSVSVDGGNIWSRGQPRSLGKRGNYVKSVCFNQLGWCPGSKGLMVKGRCVDAVPLTIAGAFITTH